MNQPTSWNFASVALGQSESNSYLPDDLLGKIKLGHVLFIFDVDGTLADSEPTLHRIFEETARRFGFSEEHIFDWAELNGKGDLNCLNWMRRVDADFRISDDEFLASYVANTLACKEFSARKELRYLFSLLQKQNRPMGINTSAAPDVARNTLSSAGYKIEDTILISGYSYPGKKKPDPHTYNIAMDSVKTHFGVKGDYHGIVFEDTSAGVEAAMAAGMTVFHILEEGMTLLTKEDISNFKNPPVTGAHYIAVPLSNLGSLIVDISLALITDKKLGPSPSPAR